MKDIFHKTRSGLQKQLIWLSDYCQKEQLYKYHAKTKFVVFVRSLPLFRWTVLNNTHAAAYKNFFIFVAVLKRTNNSY